MKNKIEIKKMVLTASLLTIAIVVDLIIGVFNLRMPFGGSFFGIAMIPLIMVGLLFGFKYGIFAGVLYALYNFGTDYLIYLDSLKITLESWTGEPWNSSKLVFLVVFDYLIPFGAYSLAGLFKEAFRKKSNFILAFIVIGLIRWLSSSLSGIILWGSSITYANEQVILGNQEINIAVKIFSLVGNNLILYSLIYNFIYIFTTVLSSIIIGLLMYNQISLLKEDYFKLPK